MLGTLLLTTLFELLFDLDLFFSGIIYPVSGFLDLLH